MDVHEHQPLYKDQEFDLNSIIGNDAHWQVNKKIARLFKCNNTAILISDLVSKETYFKAKGELNQGWFYNTGENIESDTNITPFQQRKSIALLKSAGFIETKLMGLPAKLHFKILHNQLVSFLITSCQETSQLVTNKLHTNNNKVNNNTVNKNKEINISVNANALTGDQEIWESPEDKSNLSAGAEKKKETPGCAAPHTPNNYKLMMAIYWDWFKGMNNGVTPKINGAEGKAMKEMQKYFEGLAASKIKEEGTEPDAQTVSEKACEILEYIFKNWTKLEPFLQKQVKLAQINSNITNIIHGLKNGRSTKTTQQSKSDRAGTIAEGFDAIERAFRG